LTKFEENQNTHLICDNFSPKNHSLYEIISKNIIQLDSHRQQNSMAHALCMMDA